MDTQIPFIYTQISCIYTQIPFIYTQIPCIYTQIPFIYTQIPCTLKFRVFTLNLLQVRARKGLKAGIPDFNDVPFLSLSLSHTHTPFHFFFPVCSTMTSYKGPSQGLENRIYVCLRSKASVLQSSDRCGLFKLGPVSNFTDIFEKRQNKI